jgi:hypothetical protein
MYFWKDFLQEQDRNMQFGSADANELIRIFLKKQNTA